MNYHYKKAVPVWGENLSNQWNQFLGFRVDIDLKEEAVFHLAVAARSYYRMYINGKMFCHGPARTAHQYARVDQFDITLKGKVKIAFEVASYNKPDGYSNDITLEPGMLAAEITLGEEVLAATGWELGNPFYYKELRYREPFTELLSHSRENIEVYSLDAHSYDWYTDNNTRKTPVVLMEDIPEFICRRSPYPEYKRKAFKKYLRVSDVILKVNDVKIEPDVPVLMNPKWYAMLPERLTPKVLNTAETVFTGMLNTDNGWKITSGKNDACITWDLGESLVGFPEIEMEATEDAVLDILHSDILDEEGKTSKNPCLVRYRLKKGSYHLICYEPYLVRFLKLIIRSRGTVTVKGIDIIEYMFPDKEKSNFFCSDNELNLIFEGARRTLRNNTLDIFMDCPERERGGWLCDSFWTSRAAWMLFGDLKVEKDFLENFLLTDPDKYRFSFFPEVYPGRKSDKTEIGITSWSFWLALELCEYYKRSGDREFIDNFRLRMDKFVEGVFDFIGESGLIENMPNLFVDWSESNYPSNLYPISCPINLLAAFTLESLGELYSNDQWIKAAGRIRSILANSPPIAMADPIWGAVSDALSYKDGKLISGQGMTESGAALEIWSGFCKKEEKRQFIKAFIEKMGTCPKKKSNIQVAKSNLFIGLAIRHDTLSKLKETETLVKELKDVYLPQILHGPGTLYENLDGSDSAGSLCHGFNGHAGVLLLKDVLGIGEPSRLKMTVKIEPHPLELDWASGRVDCGDGIICLDWTADHDKKKFKLNLNIPKGWNAEFTCPEELKDWKIEKNVSLYEVSGEVG